MNDLTEQNDLKNLSIGYDALLELQRKKVLNEYIRPYNELVDIYKNNPYHIVNFFHDVISESINKKNKEEDIEIAYDILFKIKKNLIINSNDSSSLYDVFFEMPSSKESIIKFLISLKSIFKDNDENAKIIDVKRIVSETRECLFSFLKEIALEKEIVIIKKEEEEVRKLFIEINNLINLSYEYLVNQNKNNQEILLWAKNFKVISNRDFLKILYTLQDRYCEIYKEVAGLDIEFYRINEAQEKFSSSIVTGKTDYEVFLRIGYLEGVGFDENVIDRLKKEIYNEYKNLSNHEIYSYFRDVRIELVNINKDNEIDSNNEDNEKNDIKLSISFKSSISDKKREGVLLLLDEKIKEQYSEIVLLNVKNETLRWEDFVRENDLRDKLSEEDLMKENRLRKKM